MSVIKKQAYLEPLVDTVKENALVTKPDCIMSVDIMTVKVDDLRWESDFSLKVKSNDFVHALIAYFDIEFTKCHKPISFSTGPESRYTHWKQTVFYLQDVLTVCSGENINGHIKVEPNTTNHRNLDISISIDFVGSVHSINRTQNYCLR